VVRARLASWYRACEVWGFIMDPALTAAVLSEFDDGVVQFRATQAVVQDGGASLVTLTVYERWSVGSDPRGDRRLESEGCVLEALSWHLQVAAESDAVGAERVDVVPDPDEIHPRVHRHPYGRENRVRLPAELAPPQQWLHQLNETLDGILDAD
jgi:hypothetical protein